MGRQKLKRGQPKGSISYLSKCLHTCKSNIDKGLWNASQIYSDYSDRMQRTARCLLLLAIGLISGGDSVALVQGFLNSVQGQPYYDVQFW